MRLIVLAAGVGSRLAPLTNDRPKCLVDLAGRPLLEWTLDAARRSGIDSVIVVGGYRADQLRRYNLTLVINEDFATTNMVHTLFLARAYFGEGFIMSYGDIAYAPQVLERVLEAPSGIHVVVDTAWRTYWERRFDNVLEDAEILKLSEDGRIMDIGGRPESLHQIDAQYIGLVAFKGDGVRALDRAIATAHTDQREGRNPFGCPRPLRALCMTDLLQGMIALGERIMPVEVGGQWVEIDSCQDLSLAEELVKEGRLASPRRV